MATSKKAARKAKQSQNLSSFNEKDIIVEMVEQAGQIAPEALILVANGASLLVDEIRMHTPDANQPIDFFSSSEDEANALEAHKAVSFLGSNFIIHDEEDKYDLVFACLPPVVSLEEWTEAIQRSLKVGGTFIIATQDTLSEENARGFEALGGNIKVLNTEDVLTSVIKVKKLSPEELEARQNRVHSQKEKRTLRYDFTASEIHDFALQLAGETKKVLSLEEEKSSVTAQYGAKIKEAKASANKLSHLVAEGYEYRDVSVEIFFHTPENGKKTIVRIDTGAKIIEQMEAREYNLFTQPKDEAWTAELAR